MKLCSKKQLLILVLLGCFNLNIVYSGDFGAGIVTNFSGFFGERTRATSKLAEKEKIKNTFIGYTGSFDRKGLGIYGSYRINLSNSFCITLYSEAIYNFSHKLIIYKTDSEKKGFYEFKKAQKGKYIKEKKDPNQFNKFFYEKLPFSFFKLHSLYIPIIVKPAFKITKSIHFFLSPYFKAKYFFKVLEGKDKEKININVSKFYNKLYLDLGIGFGFDIYLFENFLNISFTFYSSSFSILDYFGGESIYDSKNKKEPFSKTKNQEKYESIKKVNGKYNHHKFHEYGSEVCLRFDILSFFVFPEKNEPLRKLKKARPVQFS